SRNRISENIISEQFQVWKIGVGLHDSVGRYRTLHCFDINHSFDQVGAQANKSVGLRAAQRVRNNYGGADAIKQCGHRRRRVGLATSLALGTQLIRRVDRELRARIRSAKRGTDSEEGPGAFSRKALDRWHEGDILVRHAMVDW